jgi:predicted amidohydrolase YtcJ
VITDSAREMTAVPRGYADPVLLGGRVVTTGAAGEEVLRRVADPARALDATEWVVAVASSQQGARMREQRLPTKEELDAAVPDRAAYLTVGPHLLLANSRAMEAVGVAVDTPDPPGGVVERDERGLPTGWMREPAQRRFKEGRPNAQLGLEDRLAAEPHRCERRGVTQVHEIVTSPAEVRAYQTLARAGGLP